MSDRRQPRFVLKYVSLITESDPFIMKLPSSLIAFWLWIACLLSFTSSAQVANHPTDSSKNYTPPLYACLGNSTVFKSFIKVQQNYIPQDGIISPLTVPKKIKMRFVVLELNNKKRKANNFRKKHTQSLKLMVEWLNQFMSELKPPTRPVTEICGDCFIKDERIRAELVDVIFVNDTLKPKTKQGLGEDSILNVYLFVDSNKFDKNSKHPDYRFPGAWSYPGGAYNMGMQQGNLAIYMFNTFLSAENYPKIDPNMTFNDMLWFETFRLMHEIHHVLGLGHLQKDNNTNFGFDSGGCSGADFLADAFPDACPMTYDDKETINIMNSANWSNYLSPLQIARVHRNSFIGKTNRFMYPIEAPDLHPWEIDSTQVWDFSIRLFQNLIIKKNQTLTIRCRLQMPPNSKIILEKGARLIIDGGIVEAYHDNSTWLGIQLLNSSDVLNQSVEIKNNGQLKGFQ